MVHNNFIFVARFPETFDAELESRVVRTRAPKTLRYIFRIGCYFILIFFSITPELFTNCSRSYESVSQCFPGTAAVKSGFRNDILTRAASTPVYCCARTTFGLLLPHDGSAKANVMYVRTTSIDGCGSQYRRNRVLRQRRNIKTRRVCVFDLNNIAPDYFHRLHYIQQQLQSNYCSN